MRLWKTALIEKHCVFATLQAEFSNQDCTGAIRYRDELMCLMFLGSRRQPSISSLYRNRLSNDEFRVLNTIRLLEENKAQGAVRQLGDLVRGPLNFSMIRACAGIIRILQSKQLSFRLPVRLPGMNALTTHSRSKSYAQLHGSAVARSFSSVTPSAGHGSSRPVLTLG